MDVDAVDVLCEIKRQAQELAMLSPHATEEWFGEVFEIWL